ncbi:MAG: sugar phosphate isomerase/epimerase family protein [Planctomycetota bacterium]
MNALSRRRFMRRSAALGALGLAAAPHGRALAAEKPGSKMKLGLVTYLWGKDWDLPTLIGNCERSKVLGVELRTTHKHGVEVRLNADERREVKRRFDESPVVHVGIGGNERLDDPNPAKLKKAIEATKAFVKLSHDTGGSGVKVKPNSFHKGVPREKTIEQIGRSLNTLGKFAADYGQQIRLEVHGQCCLLPIIRQIMDVAEHPSAVVCWNSNSQDLQGESKDPKENLVRNFDLVKHRFGATAHVRELNVGSYPYRELIGLFVKMDYAGWILLEARTKQKDRVKALVEQRELFQAMVAEAQAKL